MSRRTPLAPPARLAPVDTGLLVALAAMWGGSFLFIEVALRAFPPLWIVTVRTAVGGVALLGILAARGRSLPRDAGTWGHLIVLGALANAIPWTAIAWAQQFVPSGLTALLMALVPTSTLIVSAVLRLERLTLPRLAGLVVALVGVVVIVVEDLDDPGRLAGIVAVVGATVLYAAGSIYARQKLAGRHRPLVIATGQVLCAAAITAPFTLLFSPAPRTENLDLAVAGSLLGLGALGTGVAFLVFYVLIERVGATNTTLVTYLIPLVAIVLGVLVLDERITPAVIAGGALVITGIWLSQRSSSGSALERLAREHR